MKIAIDVMGGDHSPHAILEGVKAILHEHSHVSFLLVGDQSTFENDIDLSHPRIEVLHTTSAVSAEEEPSKAVRMKTSSMNLAIAAVKKQEADAVISAGNTGAFMACGLFNAGRIPGVERPALAPILPTIDHRGVLVLDVGANLDPKPEHLMQYALMGEVYASAIMKKEQPRIGLLNIGSEAKKGTTVLKDVHQQLQQSSLHFVGNIEARDVLFGQCDVLVTDGFSGNIFLKSVEGMAAVLFDILKSEVTKTTSRKLGAALLKPAFKEVKNRLDYAEYGGAPLLGLQHTLVKAHGSSDAKAFKQTILQTMLLVEQKVTETISSHFS